ncbi:MAG: hypothetical protein KTR13_02575 [Saprospiraceae bacterium]|nr:hypothetical protein [Saprospiraceae bacterium]
MKIILFLCFCLASMLTHSQSKNTPCSTENYKAFHFWVGEWEVSQNGQPAGSNSITLDQGNCLMVERWTSANPPYTGTSYNHYDAAKQQWVQLWVDNQGGSLHLKGNMEDGKMVLKTDPAKDAQGNTVIHKVTWTPNEDGSVRQLWQTTTDEGATWTTAFDGLYTRID